MISERICPGLDVNGTIPAYHNWSEYIEKTVLAVD